VIDNLIRRSALIGRRLRGWVVVWISDTTRALSLPESLISGVSAVPEMSLAAHRNARDRGTLHKLRFMQMTKHPSSSAPVLRVWRWRAGSPSST
jgi:hypothetical protein